MGIIVGVIGPTNLNNHCVVLERPMDFIVRKATDVGMVLAQSEHVKELWTNLDGGMLQLVRQAYRQSGGKGQLVGLRPRKDGKWPIEHTLQYEGEVDRVKAVSSWDEANHAVVRDVDVVIMTGTSGGVFKETGTTKYDLIHQKGRLKKIVVVRELVERGELPLALYIDIAPLVEYVDTTDELAKILATMECMESHLLA